MTRRWTATRLAAATLRRQFPRVRGRGPAAVVEAYRRFGPVQTQVPRAAHLALAARLPGVTYDAITDAFESYRVVKATNLRGTVHTSTAEQHAWLAAACDHPRDLLIANHLKLSGLTPREVTDEIERYATGQWRERKALVAGMWAWLDEHNSGASNGARPSSLADGLFWGHARLVRRPRDRAWERRTDVYHQAASSVLGAEPVPADRALEELVRLHLGAYGPATRRDITWWLGGPLTRVDRAVDRLGEEIVRYAGAGDPYLDLADPPRGGTVDPGVRLLPEFDGLILGYAPPNRDRFVDPDHLERLFARENGLLSPLVLRDGRIVAAWKLRAEGRRHVVEVEMLPRLVALDEAELTGPVANLEAALATVVSDVRIR